ncbi:MAG: ferric reductase-like transmembrane domain-containing protein [Desertimonas sp.]
MSSQLAWYIARSSGIVGWALLSLSVIWGLAISTKTRPGGVRPNWLLDLHRALGGLATIFTGVHVVAMMADSYVEFGPAEVLVPLASAWKPTAVAWGVVAMYLLAAVQLTSMLRSRLPRRVWRAVHAASFPLFVSATVHGVQAGTDVSNRVFVATVWAVAALVGGLTVLRVVQAIERREVADGRGRAHRPARRARPVLTATEPR